MTYSHITVDAGAAAKFYHVVWNDLEEFKRIVMHLGASCHGVIGKTIQGIGFEEVAVKINDFNCRLQCGMDLKPVCSSTNRHTYIFQLWLHYCRQLQCLEETPRCKAIVGEEGDVCVS